MKRIIALLFAMLSSIGSAHHSELLSAPVAATCDVTSNNCPRNVAVSDSGEIKILTFHSNQYWGCDATNHPIFALESLLEPLHERKWVVVSLASVVEYFLGKRERSTLPPKAVVITFDDSFYLDVIDAQYDYCANLRGRPTPSALSVLRAFKERHPDLPEGSPHITLFVIAAGMERSYLQAAMDGWKEDLVEIGSHAVSHSHLGQVDTFAEADREIQVAQLLIMAQTKICPSFFAYPYGEASSYIVEEYFPNNHGCLAAAFSTAGGPVSREHNRWFIPRNVWGWHWTDEKTLFDMLGEDGTRKIPEPPPQQTSQ